MTIRNADTNSLSVVEFFPTNRIIATSIFAITLRYLWLSFSGEDLRFPDEHRFWCEAENFARGLPIGCGESIAHDMPLTAILLGMVILIFGPDIWMAKLLWIVISGLTAVPVAALAWSLNPSHRVALLAACGFALYPFSIYYSTLLLSETPFMLLMTSAVAVTLLLGRENDASFKGKAKHVFALGALLGFLYGITHLTRPTLMYFMPFVFAWLCWINRHSWRMSVPALAVLVCVCLPWVVRNNIAFDGAFVPGTLTSGHVMWEGNNQWNDHGGVSQVMPPEDVRASLNEYQLDQWKKSKALDHIKAHPERFVRVSLRRFIRFWNFFPNAEDYRSIYYKLISFFSIAPIIILTIAYPLLKWNQWRQWGFIATLVIYYTAIHIISIGSIRYRLPLEPIFISVSSVSVFLFISRINFLLKRQ